MYNSNLFKNNVRFPTTLCILSDGVRLDLLPILSEIYVNRPGMNFDRQLCSCSRFRRSAWDCCAPPVVRADTSGSAHKSSAVRRTIGTSFAPIRRPKKKKRPVRYNVVRRCRAPRRPPTRDCPTTRPPKIRPTTGRTTSDRNRVFFVLPIDRSGPRVTFFFHACNK